MQIGLQKLCQSWGCDNIRDHRVYEEEMSLAARADELRYDLIDAPSGRFRQACYARAADPQYGDDIGRLSIKISFHCEGECR